MPHLHKTGWELYERLPPFVLVGCTLSSHGRLHFPDLQMFHLKEVSPVPHLNLGIFVDNTNYDESIIKTKTGHRLLHGHSD